MTALPDLSTWTATGTVDLIRVHRVIVGRVPSCDLNDAERLVVIHAASRLGVPPGTIAKLLGGERHHSITRDLRLPAPVDRLGRDITAPDHWRALP